jgi:hypothetical protein
MTEIDSRGLLMLNQRVFELTGGIHLYICFTKKVALCFVVLTRIHSCQVHVGATQYTDSFSSDDIFTTKMYIAEEGPAAYSATERRMGMFLKDYLLPVCIKTVSSRHASCSFHFIFLILTNSSLYFSISLIRSC